MVFPTASVLAHGEVMIARKSLSLPTLPEVNDKNILLSISILNIFN